VNSFISIDPSLVDVILPPSGYTKEMEEEDTTDVIWDACGSAATDFPSDLWIEPKDWKDKARDNDKYGLWAMNYLDRYTDQRDTHECTTHSLRANFEAARNRMRAASYGDGPKKDFRHPDSARYGSTWMSCASVYAEANPGQWGGANVRRVVEIACRRGMLPDLIQPAEYGFKHQLQGTVGKGNNNQSSGPWVSLSQFPDGWEETAKLFKPVKVIFPSSFEEAVCLVLHGRVVSVGRSKHAVPWAQWMAAEGMLAYPDSYSITRYDSERTAKSAWRGSFAIDTVTAPDDWSQPAK